ncbi:MAG: methyltransferase domain-containing protein [Deltaproteobacteria bacterium]|nr:methyltransferase domain-containing protein [Deltaproteobacteria bacterium]
MEDYYQENHAQYYDQTFNIDPTSFLIPLARCLHPSGTILDVGCGSGRDMRWLKDRGFQPMEFEGSEGLCALARKHSGRPVIEGNFETNDFSSMHVDALLLVGALVHVPHDCFSKTLFSILQALKPQGHVLVTMKEGNQNSEVMGGRIFYLWRDESLRKVYDQLNFTVVHFSRRMSKIRETDVWLGYVLKSQ